jgi:hypothetical protein
MLCHSPFSFSPILKQVPPSRYSQMNVPEQLQSGFDRAGNALEFFECIGCKGIYWWGQQTNKGLHKIIEMLQPIREQISGFEILHQLTQERQNWDPCPAGTASFNQARQLNLLTPVKVESSSASALLPSAVASTSASDASQSASAVASLQAQLDTLAITSSSSSSELIINSARNPVEQNPDQSSASEDDDQKQPGILDEDDDAQDGVTATSSIETASSSTNSNSNTSSSNSQADVLKEFDRSDGGLWRLPFNEFRHDLQLASAYAEHSRQQLLGNGDDQVVTTLEPPATNITRTFAGTLDYIFYSRELISLKSVVSSLFLK